MSPFTIRSGIFLLRPSINFLKSLSTCFQSLTISCLAISHAFPNPTHKAGDNVPDLIPETDEEKRRYDGALRRRQLKLILAGKMKPEEATELKALFIEPKAFQQLK